MSELTDKLSVLKQLIAFSSHADDANYPKTVVLYIVGSIGFLAHVGFIFLFFIIDCKPLVLFNIFSVFVWLAVIIFNYKGRLALAINTAYFELVIHAVIAVTFLGLSPGFQYFLWPGACLAAINPKLSTKLSAPISFTACIGTLALLDYLYQDKLYQYGLAEYVDIMSVINIMAAGIPLIICITVIRIMYEAQEKRLESLASEDVLTGLFNRRYMNSFLEQSMAEAERSSRPYCVVLADLDDFKQINDLHGHGMGDRVLEKVSLYFKERLRKSDCISRWGGEEFLIAFPNTTANHAFELIETMRQLLPEYARKSVAGGLNVTMSFGVAERLLGETPDNLIKRADEALYQSKAAGRNQAIIHR